MHRICRPISRSLCRYALIASYSANMSASPKTIAVAMSGGIDSAVSALLLQDQGHKVVGVFMKNWDSSDECGSETCDIDSDQKDMKEACDRLGIPAYEVNFVKEYWNEVFSPFLEAYQAGLETPNPDAFCNRHVKFKHLLSFINNKLGIDTIATGHYSRTVHGQGLSSTRLLKGRDPLKDQSYFLCLTKGEALQKVLLPIGHLTKAEVKAIAAERLPGLRVLTKHESMGICFIGKRDMRDFLEDYITLTPGRFIDLDTGRVVGTHDAFEYFTVGQKARLSGNPQKYYVVGRKKNLVQPSSSSAQRASQELTAVAMTGNHGLTAATTDEAPTAGGAVDRPTVSGDVYVVSGSEHPTLYSPYIEQPLSTLNWIAGAPPPALRALLERVELRSGDGSRAEQGFRCECKCRYSQPPTPCTIQVLPRQNNHNPEDALLRIVFDIPQRAITAGQIIALYDGEVCLGGGVIAPQPLFVGPDKTPMYL